MAPPILIDCSEPGSIWANLIRSQGVFYIFLLGLNRAFQTNGQLWSYLHFYGQILRLRPFPPIGPTSPCCIRITLRAYVTIQENALRVIRLGKYWRFPAQKWPQKSKWWFLTFYIFSPSYGPPILVDYSSCGSIRTNLIWSQGVFYIFLLGLNRAFQTNCQLWSYLHSHGQT